jgi:phosphoglucosamine mutase
MARLVVRYQADLGIAFDGDGDRCILVDHKGRVVDGDHILAICALDMQKRQTLKRKTVVATVMSNFGLEKALKDNGLKLLRSNVGDRYVLEAMLKGGYNLGGEQSGHLVFLNYSTTGDGILTALRLLSVMLREQKSLADLACCMEVYPQVLLNLRVKERRDLGTVPRAQKAIQVAEKRLQGWGRLLVRFSGTEPLLRVMVEGDNAQEINEVAQELVHNLDVCLNSGGGSC